MTNNTVLEDSSEVRQLRRSVSSRPSPLTTSKSWQDLKNHYSVMRDLKMRQMFADDSDRFSKFSIEFENILLDYSKNRISEKTLELLIALATEHGVPEKIEKMFSGDKINWTEKRAVLHTALRNCSDQPVLFDGEDVMPTIRRELTHMREFSDKVRNGEWRGFTGKKITDVVNIGIGGSELGPRLACTSLQPWEHPDISTHFLSNIDGTRATQVLSKIDPETTLFIVASKTFTTQETMTNAKTARQWLLDTIKDEKAVASHFVAISTNETAVIEFGIDKTSIFYFWDWVGGRYSLWSSIGLSVAISLGMDNFEQMLEGAHAMDNHFRNTPFNKNIPVILGLLGIWYTNFFMAQHHGILPYDHYMDALVDYLQQLDMESNGKCINSTRSKVDHSTGPIIWGRAGTNGQHAFYQLLHQGTDLVPCDFIAPVESCNPVGEHHDILLANFLGQSEALMLGRTQEEAEVILTAKGISGAQLEELAPHVSFAGNRPSNSILIKKQTPRTLGAILAMYEHKVFVQGVIWDINSYDQWGVELGKTLATSIFDDLKSDNPVDTHDSSTNGLINFIKKTRK